MCACEHVTAAEINAALVGPVAATSADGVRKRTGAAYGRCQGSLCLAGHLVPDRDEHRHGAGLGPADRARDGRIMTAPFLVVGAGPTGLGCAAELTAARPVELIDRIPVPGGEAGWSAPEITSLAADARRRRRPVPPGKHRAALGAGPPARGRPGQDRGIPGERLFYAGGRTPAHGR